MSRVTLRHRFLAIIVLVAVLGLWVVVGVRDALAPGAGEYERSRALRTALQLHQDIDMMHDALRADVYASFLGAGDPASDLRRHRAQVDADLAALDRLPLTADAVEALREVRDPLLEWADEADGLSRLAQVDRGGAEVRLPSFAVDFQQLATSLEATTGVLSAGLSAAEAREGDMREGIRWSVAVRTAGAVAVVCLAMAIVGAHALTSLDRVREVARRFARGDLGARNVEAGADEIGDLARTFDELASSLETMAARGETEAAQLRFAGQLAQALEMAETEADVADVARIALGEIGGCTSADVLLADSSRAKLKVVTGDDARHCSVETPWACVAMRRATPMAFPSNAALDCCPRLRGAPPCSALCVPVNFTGRAVGVVRTTWTGATADPESAARLTTLANLAGARIGAIRAMDQARLQASTDGLTGLVNRRSLEARVRVLERPYAVIMADLDHFKRLNDTFGHQAGDAALRLFGQTVRAQQRADDIACRYGGEEFVIVMPRCTVAEALLAADRIRIALAASFTGGAPPFTASCGVADSSGREGFDEVLRAADVALYAAKAQGRDRAVSA